MTTENGVDQSCTWEYDDNDNIYRVMDTVADERYTTAYNYDDDDRLKKTYYNNGSYQNSHNVVYDGYGRVSTVTGTWRDGPSGTGTVLNRLTTTYTYYNRNSIYTTHLPATITNTPAVGTAQVLTYTYDVNGNIATAKRGSNTTTYNYDEANQLIRENNQAAGKTWIYEYDKGGNILKRTEYSYTTAESPTGGTEVSYTYNTGGWRDVLKTYNGTTLTHDAIGNLTNDGTWTYTWQGGRQLAGMSKTGTTLAFDYDESGLRTAKTVGSTATYYTYIGSQLSSETTGGSTMYFHYDANGSPVGFRYNDKLYMYAKNLQGDIIGIVDQSGAMVVEYTYDAWGNLLTTTGSAASTVGAANPLRYRGYYYDEETGLYYLQSRYYNPTWGRFINADAYPQTTGDSIGANMFAYCANNPVARTDDSGEFWNVIIGAAVGAVVGAVHAVANGESVVAGMLIGAAEGAVSAAIPGIAGVAAVCGDLMNQTANLMLGNRKEVDINEALWIGVGAFVGDITSCGITRHMAEPLSKTAAEFAKELVGQAHGVVGSEMVNLGREVYKSKYDNQSNNDTLSNNTVYKVSQPDNRWTDLTKQSRKISGGVM